TTLIFPLSLHDALPILLRLMLHGSADCAKISWTLFGISLPEWSLLAFIGMILFSLYLLLRRRCSAGGLLAALAAPEQAGFRALRSEEHTSELQSRENLV